MKPPKREIALLPMTAPDPLYDSAAAAVAANVTLIAALIKVGKAAHQHGNTNSDAMPKGT